MEKRHDLSKELDYPENLIDGLNSRYSLGADIVLNDDKLEGLGIAFGSLTNQEKETIRLRYEEKLSLDAIGKSYGGMSREGVRKIEERALRKLSKPEAARWFVLGKKFCERNNSSANSIIKGYALEDIIPTTEVSLLPLSNRTANALRKCGIHTAEELFGASIQDISTLHIGEGSLREVISLLRNSSFAKNIRKDSLMQRIEDSDLCSEDKYAIKRGLIELQSLRTKYENQ